LEVSGPLDNLRSGICRQRRAVCALVALSLFVAAATGAAATAQQRGGTSQQSNSAASSSKASQGQNGQAVNRDTPGTETLPSPSASTRSTEDEAWRKFWTTAGLVAAPVVVAFAALIAGWALRQLIFVWWRIRRSPRLDIPLLVNGAGLNNDQVIDITARLRHELVTVDLPSAKSLPGATSSDDFLELVRGGTHQEQGVVGNVAGFLRAIFPRHAHRIHGTLMTRKAEPRCGISIQLVSEMRWLTRADPVTVWDKTWDRAIRRAAHTLAGQVLPRTRRVRLTPWAAWRGPIPPELIDTHLTATELRSNRRLDEAMEKYFEALKLDPLNPSLNYELGQLQEKLALYLDAIETYGRIVNHRMMADANARRPRRLWCVLKRGRRAHNKVVLLARYRRAVLLGFGERLVETWDREPEATWTRRDEERRELRKRLREDFATHHHAALANPNDEAAANEIRAILVVDPPSDEVGRKLHRTQLIGLFNVVAKQEADILLEKLPRGRSPGGLTRTSAELMQAWAHERAEHGETEWPPPMDDFGVVEKVLTKKRLPRRRYRWQDFYNAACIYGAALIGPTVEADRKPEYVDAAVNKLRMAAARVGSSTLAEFKAWIVSEDPDLDEVRPDDGFRAFEAQYLPSPRPAPLRPRNVHRLELARYDSAVIREAARRFERVWHARAGVQANYVDIHEIRRWWREEILAWENAHRLARDHRHWQTRREVVRATADWSRRNGAGEFKIAHPRYSDEPIDPDYSAVANGAGPEDPIEKLNRSAEDSKKAADDRCEKLAGLLKPDGPLRTANASMAEELAKADRDGMTLNKESLRELCDGRAALWQLLHEWFRGDAGRGAQFEAAAGTVPAIGKRVANWRAATGTDAPTNRSGNGAAPDYAVARLGEP
jgi:hypothetical protein